MSEVADFIDFASGIFEGFLHTLHQSPRSLQTHSQPCRRTFCAPIERSALAWACICQRVGLPPVWRYLDKQTKTLKQVAKDTSDYHAKERGRELLGSANAHFNDAQSGDKTSVIQVKPL